MNSKERVMCALRGVKPDCVPFVETRVDPVLQEALLGKKLQFPDTITHTTQLCNPDLNELIGLDNLQFRFLPPIFAELHASADGLVPTKPLLRTEADVSKMTFPDPNDPALYREAEAVINAHGDRYAVGATLRSGISATHMSFGLEGLSYALVDSPGLVETVFRKYSSWAIAVMKNLKNMGFDFIWTADDMAYKAGPMFSPEMFRGLFKPLMREFAEAVKSHGFLWILHSDGDVSTYIDDLIDIGIDGLHPIEPGAMDIEQLKRDYVGRLCLVGNIDLHYTLTRGTPEEVDAEVKRRIEVIGAGGGYMISSANSLTSYCKVENVWAMINAIKAYRGKGCC
ncbi:MAG TPA: uroporphyrinogen decarboxylase family protein [Thermoguttaceae bacterium]|nr:uroporphyrinogen decarboxylase family protein [Thermoguttaceae bacterium]